MERTLPRGWETEARAALNDEELLAGSQIRADPASVAESLILVTETRFLHVTRSDVRSWPIATVGVAEVQENSKGQPGGITIVIADPAGDRATDEVHRFVAPNRDAAYGCDTVADELRFSTLPAVATRIAELTWWDAKPAWSYAALGRIAGGTLAVEAGEEVSVGLGRRGVSLYAPNSSAPHLQLPWTEITGVSIETQDQLKERLGPTVVTAMGLLQWRYKVRGLRGRLGLEAFIGISTKTSELYVAAKAPAVELRKYWASVLERFEMEPDEALLTGRAPTAELGLFADEDDAPVRAADRTVRKAHDRNVVEELERLSALHDSGALTEAEYAAAKANILGRPQS